MKFSARLRKGFTLIELLIVIVIIGILAVGLVPKVIDAPKKARDTVRKTDLNQIKIAVESYYSDKGSYPANILDATLGSYFQGGKSPVDPSGVAYSYSKDNADSAAKYKCYILGVQTESGQGGNSAAVLANIGTMKCDATLKAGDGNLYYVIGSNY